jgi:TolA-binding protein
MTQVAWILVLAIGAGVGYSLWRFRRKAEERREAAEARMAQLMAQAVRPGAAPAAGTDAAAQAALAQQRLLLDAAGKAAEAGEPALAIQLYARLIARYPGGPSAALARTAVEAQKKRLSLSRSPGTSAPG